MWQHRFLKMLDEHADALLGNGTARFLFLTLTVKNCEPSELRETIKLMQTAWNRLVALKEWPAIGFVKSVEVTRNEETGQAHPHFHCVLMVPAGYFKRGYLSQARWVELWQQCLRVSYAPSVHVKAVRDRSGDALRKALHETLKYSVKPADVAADPEWLEMLTEQMHNVRSVSVGGNFRNFLKATEPDDLISENESELDVEETEMTWAAWKRDVQRYQIAKGLS